jgi:hypothetical protein
VHNDGKKDVWKVRQVNKQVPDYNGPLNCAKNVCVGRELLWIDGWDIDTCRQFNGEWQCCA